MKCGTAKPFTSRARLFFKPLQTRANELNAEVGQLLQIHLLLHRYVLIRHNRQPSPLPPPKPDLSGRNPSRQHVLLAAWRASQDERTKTQAAILNLWQQCNAGNMEAMQAWLTQYLPRLSWPHETPVDFSLPDAATLLLDVEVAALDEMPTYVAVAQRGRLALDFHQSSETSRRKEYLAYIHNVAFRLVGEAMAALPTVQTIIISLHTAVLDPASFHSGPGFIASARIDRATWHRIDFTALDRMDMVDLFAVFELRRTITRGHILQPWNHLAIKLKKSHETPLFRLAPHENRHR